jgi:ABC-2 type transport system ATP-binding protein
LLHGGRLLALDTPAALRGTLPGSLLEVVAADHRQLARVLKTLPGVQDVQMFGERAHVRLKELDASTGVERLSSGLRGAGVQEASVRPVRASLEDVFVSRLGEVQS